MGVNHVTTADGEELINLMSDTVDEYSLLEGATAHDASGEQIRGKAVYVNPNLLDNGDLSVNQRGKTEYVGSGYTADRWNIGGAGGKVVLGKDTVTISSDGAAMAYVNQPLPMGDELAGQTLTASLVLADGTRLTGSGVCPVSPSSGFSLFITIPINDSIGVRVYKGVDTIIWQFRMTAECSVEFQRKFKLELGKVATPFVPPNPAVELVKCQRYLFTPPCISSSNYLNKPNSMWFLIPLPTTMKTTPSILPDTVINLYSCEGNALLVSDILNNSEYSIISHGFGEGNQLIILINKASHGYTQGQVYLSLPAGSGGFSAEL